MRHVFVQGLGVRGTPVVSGFHKTNENLNLDQTSLCDVVLNLSNV